MEVTLLGYPKCSTCKKAEAWLKEQNIEFKYRHIVEQNPTVCELKEWLSMGTPINKMFNTSGLKYRALGMKDKMKELSLDDLIALLAEDGMLVKRPILVLEKQICFGFKPEEWKNALIR